MGFIFLHITKTAGRSITSVIEKAGVQTPQHCYVKDLDYTNNIIISVCRNPYARVHSQYHFYKNQRDAIPAHMSFKEFCARYPEWKNHPLSSNTFDTCFNFMSDKGSLRVEEILRFENISKDFDILCKKYNFNISLPKLNVNNLKNPIHLDYNEEILNYINKFFEQDFIHFNYKPASNMKDFLNTPI